MESRDVDVSLKFSSLVACLLKQRGMNRTSQIPRDSGEVARLTAKASDYAGRRLAAELDAFFKGRNPLQLTDEEIWVDVAAAKEKKEVPIWELWARQDEEEARRWGDEEEPVARQAICP